METKKYEERVFHNYDKISVSSVSSKRTSRGRYRYRLWTKKVDGVYKYRSFEANNKSVLVEMVNCFIEEKISGSKDVIYEKATKVFSEYLSQKYMTHYKKKERHTYQAILRVYNNQILPYITDLRIMELTVDKCQAIINEIISLGYSYSVIRKAYYLMRDFLCFLTDDMDVIVKKIIKFKMPEVKEIKTARREMLSKKEDLENKQELGIALSSDEDAIVHSRLRYKDSKQRNLTKAEIARIKDIAYNGVTHVRKRKNGEIIVRKDGEESTVCYTFVQPKVFLFALQSGLRTGELLSIKFENVDFENHTLKVENNSKRTMVFDKSGRPVRRKKKILQDGKETSVYVYKYERFDGETKTGNEEDTIYLSDDAITVLKEMLEEDKKQFGDSYHGYIVHDSEGHEITASTLRNRWNSLLTNAGIVPCGLHVLRHTYGNIVYRGTDKDLRITQKQMRHKSLTTTANTYLHANDEEIARQMKNIKI